MNLNDLVYIFHTAAWERQSARFDKADEHRGIRAVVEALRSHFHKKTGTWEPTWAQVEVDILFEDILAGNGESHDT
jgi:hypothetical protein